MDDEEDIKLGDIVPLHSTNFGGTFVRCSGMVYGVVISFTTKNNPRATPIYHKQPQHFTGYKDPYILMRRRSSIMFGVIAIDKAKWLKKAVTRQSNYTRIMRVVNRGIAEIEEERKKNEKPKAHNDYFSF